VWAITSYFLKKTFWIIFLLLLLPVSNSSQRSRFTFANMSLHRLFLCSILLLPLQPVCSILPLTYSASAWLPPGNHASRTCQNCYLPTMFVLVLFAWTVPFLDSHISSGLFFHVIVSWLPSQIPHLKFYFPQNLPPFQLNFSSEHLLWPGFCLLGFLCYLFFY
jgi:hypothetical protein